MVRGRARKLAAGKRATGVSPGTSLMTPPREKDVVRDAGVGSGRLRRVEVLLGQAGDTRRWFAASSCGRDHVFFTHHGWKGLEEPTPQGGPSPVPGTQTKRTRSLEPECTCGAGTSRRVPGSRRSAGKLLLEMSEIWRKIGLW